MVPTRFNRFALVCAIAAIAGCVQVYTGNLGQPAAVQHLGGPVAAGPAAAAGPVAAPLQAPADTHVPAPAYPAQISTPAVVAHAGHGAHDASGGRDAGHAPPAGTHGAPGVHPVAVDDRVITQQRQRLAANTRNKGFGPQAPRDIESRAGSNTRSFTAAPPSNTMNLCNIHFHKNAEHKGGEFSTYAGNGDGHGYQGGFVYSGRLAQSELGPLHGEVCPSEHGGLRPGDTIEVHYVYSSAQVEPGPTLAACMNDAIKNPDLRVEAQVYVLVTNRNAYDFNRLAAHELRHGLHQAVNMPDWTGAPVQYAGSTTGPGYNEKGSPFQVTWSVRPHVAKVNIETVGEWCRGNVFKEDHAHGVRNLVVNPELLSAMGR
ncbi:MAG: delta-class carbonic anhydrase [Burkholderiaceae bacterium]